MTSRPGCKATRRERIARWWRYNAVGAMGSVLQLMVVAVLGRRVPGRAVSHPLAVSALAVELAVVHNFLWHRRWTWKGRTGRVWGAFTRFQLGNGLLSLLLTEALLPALLGIAHLPIVAANAGTIALGSLANFSLGEWWVFACPDLPADPPVLQRERPARIEPEG